MTRPIRVLWVIKGLGRGGAERLLLSIAEASDGSSGVEYECAYVLSHKDQFRAAMEAEGVPCHLLGSGRVEDPRWLWDLRRLVHDGRFDAVHFHSPLVAGLGRPVVASLRPRLAIVTTEHHEWQVFNALTRQVNAATYGLNDAVFGVSQQATDSIPDRFAATTLVHGVDPVGMESHFDNRDRIRRELGLAEGQLLAVTVANLRVQKDYPNLLQAAAKVLAHRNDVVFAAAGGGPLEEDVRRLHQELGLGPAFQILGTRGDARDLIAAADVFVLASKDEGLPVVVMEALTLGRPIVATAVGGVAQALAHEKDALLIPAQDPGAFATAIERLLDDQGLRERLASGATRSAEGFDIRRAVEKAEATYRELVQVKSNSSNTDKATVEGFGEEWSRFDQRQRTEADLRETFDKYFAIFPWDSLPEQAVGLDVGCGSGRWANVVAPRVGHLTCVDPSDKARAVAERNLAHHDNVTVAVGSAGALPIPDQSMDFAYSLGVIHHTPDPMAATKDIVRTLKPGAPLLVYLYYALDNRPSWFRALWRLSDSMRRAVAGLPVRIRTRVTDAIALLVYWPLSRMAGLLGRLGAPMDALPLSSYRTKPLYVLRTDALDRFGTAVEHRYSRSDAARLLTEAGLTSIAVADGPPHWCLLGVRPQQDLENLLTGVHPVVYEPLKVIDGYAPPHIF